jgi:type IV pilus biogenesis protein CpaD/CtpE
MLRGPATLALVTLALAGCGSRQQTHGVLGAQATLTQSRIDRQLEQIDWTLHRAQTRLGRSSGTAHGQVLALVQTTLLREAARLEQVPVPSRVAPLKADLVLALRALARDATLASLDVRTVRTALANLG